jgi:hypothetical protein
MILWTFPIFLSFKKNMGEGPTGQTQPLGLGRAEWFGLANQPSRPLISPLAHSLLSHVWWRRGLRRLRVLRPAPLPPWVKIDAPLDALWLCPYWSAFPFRPRHHAPPSKPRVSGDVVLGFNMGLLWLLRCCGDLMVLLGFSFVLVSPA